MDQVTSLRHSDFFPINGDLNYKPAGRATHDTNTGVELARRESAGAPTAAPTFRTDTILLAPPYSNLNPPSSERIQTTLETDEGKLMADASQILKLLHELFLEMRRQASESRQDAYLEQWKRLDYKAGDMRSAARKDLAAGIVGASFSIAGGTAGLFAGISALKNSKQGSPINKEPTIEPQQAPQTGLDTPPVEASTNTLNARSPATEGTTRPNNSADTPEHQTRPLQPDGEGVHDTSNKQSTGPSDKNSRSLALSSLSMVIGQTTPGIGGLVTSPVKFQADLDRATSQRQDAMATKASADVESEAQFWRTTNDGNKSSLDTLNQLVTSRHEVHNKIWS